MDLVLSRKSDQSQLNVSHGDSISLLKMAGAPLDIYLGSPRNGKPSLRLTVKVKGRKIVWVQGDTHAIWLSHQEEPESRALFDALLRQLKVGDSVAVDVVGAQLVDVKPKRLDDLKLDVDGPGIGGRG